ncbi:MAG: hypothetical protein AVDCRST_MAG38-1655, partial [uncultured Solirubrobacteraceae bacterium]
GRARPGPPPRAARGRAALRRALGRPRRRQLPPHRLPRPDAPVPVSRRLDRGGPGLARPRAPDRRGGAPLRRRDPPRPRPRRRRARGGARSRRGRRRLRPGRSRRLPRRPPAGPRALHEPASALVELQRDVDAGAAAGRRLRHRAAARVPGGPVPRRRAHRHPPRLAVHGGGPL